MYSIWLMSRKKFTAAGIAKKNIQNNSKTAFPVYKEGSFFILSIWLALIRNRDLQTYPLF